ncbi:hypothetical protein [Streptomyces sp. NPDC049916]|uniref:hypothetical protein n=1 Tax=Streptomyces sp. NPDC049916 TaxID=3155156 RepID=UPI003434AEFB
MGRPLRLGECGDEDRAAYANALDEVIGSPEIRQLLDRSGTSAAWLRARALAAAPLTAAAADAEYRRFAALREELPGARRDTGTPLSGPGGQERPGAGVLAVLGVLTPVLAAVAAATFLLLGYGLRLAGSLPALAGTLVGVGWISLAVAAAASMVGIVALYRTAAGQSADGPPVAPTASPALDQARDAWLKALREKAIRPCLRQELTGAAAARDPAGAIAPAAPAGRTARFTPPAFAGPDFGRPGFSAPGFSGPGQDAPSGPPLPGARS